MSRLIDADVIYQWYRDSFDFKPNEVKFSMIDIRNNLENIPTADVPNMTGNLIIRCKDCKWHRGQWHCLNTDSYGYGLDDFCSLAERGDSDERHDDIP